MDDPLIHELHKRKLIDRGFTVTNGVITPPSGMGDFAAVEVAETCLKEARREAQDQAAGIKAVAVPEPAGGVTAGDGPFWHEQNPWNDRILYVWLDELAECMSAIGKELFTTQGETIFVTKKVIIDGWRQYGTKLDAYVLTGPVLTGGVRYGPDGPDYLSPGFSLPKLYGLLKKYRSH